MVWDRTFARGPIGLAVKIALLASLIGVNACRPRSAGTNLKDDESSIAENVEWRGNGSYPIWSYDAGPGRDAADTSYDPNSEMSPFGKQLLDLNARVPSFPGLSTAIYGDQMFRPAFGPIPWRMMQKPNSVKILFIGQDGTHIAEAAGRPATAGFGGRAQDLAKYFGVGSSAAFINTFAFTIRWQYGAFDTPVISNFGGTSKYSTTSFVGNPIWLISQDLDSPLVKWRNDLITWIIKNNRDSLKMIVLFGGGARDAMGTYVVSKGGKVGTRYTEADLAKVKVPEFDLAGAGSNKQTAFPLTKNGKDLYKEFNGANPAYTDPVKVKALQDSFRQAFNQSPDQWKAKMVLPGANVGLNGSGMIHQAQLGGYNIDEKMEIQDPATGEFRVTNSLRGLRIDNDLVIDHDILVTQLPHPTALSMMQPADASRAVGEGLTAFDKYPEWTINADPGYTNTFATPGPNGEAHAPYKYSRGDMGPEYYDFGAPNSRMVNVSTASRSGKNVIVFGTREQAGFNNDLLKKMEVAAKPSKFPPESEMWISRPTSTGEGNRLTTFDPGPGLDMAKVMKTSLPRDAEFVKKREVNGDFGHYRGRFVNPEVVILADPDGDDDLITARALTGTRGQYLNSLMTGFGVDDRYLIIKTAPYSNYGSAGPEDQPQTNDDKLWRETFDKTATYRQEVLKKLFASARPKMVLTDGPWAAAAYKALYQDACPFTDSPCKVFHLERKKSAATATYEQLLEDKKFGLAEVVDVARSAGFSEANFNGALKDIPRSHLTYYARVWEGTSGDRVITSNTTQFRGIAFAEVAPRWATNQKYRMPNTEVDDCKRLVAKANQLKVRMGGEPMFKYLNRLQNGGAGTANCTGLQGNDATEGSVAAAAASDAAEVITSMMVKDQEDPRLNHVQYHEPLKTPPLPGSED